MLIFPVFNHLFFFHGSDLSHHPAISLFHVCLYLPCSYQFFTPAIARAAGQEAHTLKQKRDCVGKNLAFRARNSIKTRAPPGALLYGLFNEFNSTSPVRGSAKSLGGISLLINRSIKKCLIYFTLIHKCLIYFTLIHHNAQFIRH